MVGCYLQTHSGLLVMVVAHAAWPPAQQSEQSGTRDQIPWQLLEQTWPPAVLTLQRLQFSLAPNNQLMQHGSSRQGSDASSHHAEPWHAA